MASRPPTGGITKAQKSGASPLYSKLYNAARKAFTNLSGAKLQNKVNQLWASLKKDEDLVIQKIHELNEKATKNKAGLLAFWSKVPKSNNLASSSSSSSSSSKTPSKKRPTVSSRYAG